MYRIVGVTSRGGIIPDNEYEDKCKAIDIAMFLVNYGLVKWVDVVNDDTRKAIYHGVQG